jgi:tetratricopeptide (TPR) repeat protein
MYTNHYTAADTAYRRILLDNPRSAVAHADYALFLNYRNDFPRARAEAGKAADLGPHDGRVQAILCRVDDWSQLLSAAVTAGRAAVQAAPSDPLAHLFLSEALADSGDTAAAQDQIDASTPLIDQQPTDYLRAERHREQGNLQGDRGDLGGQVASYQAARDAQPGWLYRSIELVDSQLTANQSSAARQTLDAAAQQSPGDVATLQTLGADAFLIGDAPAAMTIWATALALAPDDPAVLDMAGETQIAANHDINAAITDFEAALAAKPNDVQAAAYLMAIARYLQHDETLGRAEIRDAVRAGAAGQRPGKAPAPPDPDAVWRADAQQALDAVNSARSAAGLVPVQLDASLSASARSHSYYWLFNNLSPTVADLGIHEETPGLLGYSGTFAWTRAAAWGYGAPHVGEDITHRGAPAPAVADWVNSVYHRFAIMRSDLAVIGYGEGDVGSVLMEDMEFGFAAAPTSTPALFPGAGQTGVPTSFVDNELPDPVPPGQPRVAGYPVTVTFSPVDAVHMTSFTLSGPDGVALPAYLLQPSGATENSASLLPKSPLHTGTTYTAHVVATINGSSFMRSWSFTTVS